jgi:hypothetical protein
MEGTVMDIQKFSEYLKIRNRKDNIRYILLFIAGTYMMLVYIYRLAVKADMGRLFSYGFVMWSVLFTACGYNRYMRVKGDFLTGDYIYGIIRTQGFDAKKYLAYIYRRMIIADFIVILPALIAGLAIGNSEYIKLAVFVLITALVTMAVLFGIFHYRIYENGNAITTGMIEVLRLAYHLLVDILLLTVFISLFFLLFDIG